MTLGALNLNAQKDARDFGRRVVGIGRLGQDQGRGAIFADVAGRGNDGLGDLVPMLAGIQCVGHPDVEGRCRQQCPIFLAAIKDHVAPVASPILAILLVGQQPLDHCRAFVGLGVEGKPRHILRRRQGSDQIERHAAQECFVVDKPGRARSGLACFSANVLLRQKRVDLGCRLPWIGSRRLSDRGEQNAASHPKRYRQTGGPSAPGRAASQQPTRMETVR